MDEEKQRLIEEVKKSFEFLKQAKRTRYTKYFYDFNKAVMKWPDLYPPLHKKVCDFIQDNIDKKRILLLLPRGTFKSSVVTASFPAWMIAKNPNTRGLIANSTYPMAVNFLGQVKDVLTKNQEFIDLFGDLATDAPVWREDAFSVNARKAYTSKEQTLTALGIGSNYTGLHFDWAILDDLVNRDNIRTMDRISEVITFYKDVLDLVDPDPLTGHKKVIIIGTCWHEADLYSWIEDKENGVLEDFAVMKLPAFGSFEGSKWVGEWGKGDLLFPTRLTWKVMEELKRNQGSSHFAAQYLLDPVPEENATFKTFKYYDKENLKGVKLNKFITVDPALTEKKESDYSAMICIGVDYKNTWYIVDMWRDKVSPKKLLDKIFEWDLEYRPITIGMESTAFQKTLQFFLQDEMKRRGQYIPITELSHTDRSKEERIKGLEPRNENGAILLPKNHFLTKFLVDEMRRFPKSKNDDLVDALASGLEVCYPPKAFQARLHSYTHKNNYPA